MSSNSWTSTRLNDWRASSSSSDISSDRRPWLTSTVGQKPDTLSTSSARLCQQHISSNQRYSTTQIHALLLDHSGPRPATGPLQSNVALVRSWNMTALGPCTAFAWDAVVAGCKHQTLCTCMWHWSPATAGKVRQYGKCIYATFWTSKLANSILAQAYMSPKLGSF